ncbi:hypothetical protein SAMN05421678_115202 [Actinopolymorpha cephalotaxi]|uniref:DUF7144 domain-containing protein n=1 Tax=Actinopolymorpha cephalotaxi TaxID=504797 RepID=A0A1I2Z6R6_9ACTN|nr:hypothetical protein [Actinopolymorpha cephalotaxi]NYH81883.1 hypothetical protein [Actinopolymorpha cephalotaxi]SFH33275.1 hypothetical protein SAMN05421678_115202 [Actinopolymorpha cephalotaxi]
MTEHGDMGTPAQEGRQRAQQAQGQAEGMREQAQGQAQQARDTGRDMGRGDSGRDTGRDTGQTKQAEAQATVPKARRSAEAEAEGRGGRMSTMPEAVGGTGWLVYAGVVLIVLGCLQAIWGFTSLFKTTYFLVASSGLVIPWGYTAWGWFHIGLAALLVITGLALLAGQTWARYVGIAIAAVSLLANFLSLAAFPIWSAIMIAVDILVIYALSVHGRELSAMRD